MVDRVEIAHTLPIVIVMTVEEQDHALTSEEAPILHVWNVVSVKPLGKGLIAGGFLKGPGIVFHGDETKHEDLP